MDESGTGVAVTAGEGQGLSTAAPIDQIACRARGGVVDAASEGVGGRLVDLQVAPRRQIDRAAGAGESRDALDGFVQIHRAGRHIEDSGRIQRPLRIEVEGPAGQGDLGGARQAARHVAVGGADVERATVDRGAAGVSVVAGQNERTSAGLDDRSAPSNDIAVGHTIAAKESEVRASSQGNVSHDRTGGPAIAEHQSASIADRGPAGVGVVTTESQPAVADFA